MRINMMGETTEGGEVTITGIKLVASFAKKRDTSEMGTMAIESINKYLRPLGGIVSLTSNTEITISD